MRIVKIQRVGQSARILPIHVKEGDTRGKSTRFCILVSGRPRSQELRDLVSFHVDKTGPRSDAGVCCDDCDAWAPSFY